MKDSEIRKIVFITLFFLLLTSFVQKVIAEEKSSRIHYTDKEGLPRNIVSCFLTDKYGYGWVGSGNGVARFDGYNFVTYETLKGRTINSLSLDYNNKLWVGSDEGLFIYNPFNDSFQLIGGGYIKGLTNYNGDIYYMLANRLVKLNPNLEQKEYAISKLNAFTVTKEGIWYNAGNNGIKLLDSSIEYLKGRVISLIEEIDNNLWIACRNGDVYRINQQKEIFEIDITNREKVMDIERIGDEIWISTDGNGIIVLDKLYKQARHLKKEKGENSILTSNSVYDVSVGLNNAIWISTWGAGLICLVDENSAFTSITPNPGNPNSLIDKEGVTVFVDKELYYLGTNYGLSIWNKTKNRFRNIDSEQLQNQVLGTKVTAVNSTSQNIWIATYDGVLGKYSKNLELQKTYHPATERPNEMQRIISIEKVDDNTLLIGTQFLNSNLFRFDIKTEQFSLVEQTSRTDNKTRILLNVIRKNQFGEIVGLVRNAGLFLYDLENNTLENFLPEINNRITFRLNDFYHDKNGNYWLTTQADGLVRMSPDGRIFDKWTVDQGFPTNTLLRLESTDDKTLWISSIDGLCRFDMKTGQIQVFNYRQGLASNDFTPRTSAITPENKIIFGNSEGFALVDPEKIIPDTSKSEVVISDIIFQNKSIKKLENDKFLEVPIEETKNLSLPFKRNSFTISFFTKDNYLPKYNNFEYRLVGFEEEWIYLGKNNQTTYTSLSPGKYTFQVRSTNKSNIWNENPTNLQIRILPPWYLTWIAFICYFVFAVLNLIIIFRIYAKRIQLRKEIEISEFKVKSEHELTEKKLAFFTNISHDLKTPLTLISAPINDLLLSKNLDKEQIKKLDVAKRNAARLYKLITDLIDFRKLTQRQLPLRVQSTDLKPVIENIFESFRIECKKHDLDVSYSYGLKQEVYVDVKKIEKILWNLVANAIKFTPNSGTIWLTIDSRTFSDEEYLIMEVGDTGKGISENEKKKIFDRFYQIQKSDNIKFDGSGIGLSIVSDLVDIHKGKIEVESKQGGGSVFTVTIPAEKKHYSNQEIVSFFTSETEALMPNIDSQISHSDEFKETTKKYSLPKILIVEDNKELIEYLSSHFSKSFKVYKALNGKEGLELANSKEPDLIITDVQMPEMDGIEFSKKIRENYNLSHTPIIMLTANSATEKKVEGLVAGADSYVTKPFEIQYLDAVAKSLLDNRKRAKEKFLGIEPIKGELEKYSASDIEFINQLKELIFENITNENLNIELLSKHFSISRTQLNRKIKALTNSTPNNYIRTIRLKKAYELIKNKHMRVSEAAYSTGFTDPNYFTFCFKKEFGENPSKI